MKFLLFVKIINWLLLIVFAISLAVRHIFLTNPLELIEVANLLPWIGMLLAMRKLAQNWQIWFARIVNILFLIFMVYLVGLMALRDARILSALLFFAIGIVPCVINLYVLFRNNRVHAAVIKN